MTILEILSIISNLAKQNNLSEPFIVGGLPRDKMLDNLDKVQDIDLTSGDKSVSKLAELFYQHLNTKGIDSHIKSFPDGHAQVTADGLKVDFSSNYNSPQAVPLLQKAGIENPSSMLIELMSRDFTVNTLLLNLGLGTVKDPTGTGIQDLKSKIIRTPLLPSITLANDPKRIVRAIYLAAKLDFDVEKPIIDFVSSNPQLLDEVKPRFITDKLHTALDYNPQKTVDLITKMKLWNYIPISERLRPYAVGRL